MVSSTLPINYFLLQGRTPWEVCIFLSHFPQKVGHRDKGVGTRDLWPPSSHLGKETAASTYLTGDIGLSEETHENCL